MSLDARTAVRTVAFAADGQRLATAGDDHVVRLWDSRTGQSLAELTGHTDKVSDVAFSPDGHRLASAGSDEALRLWNTDAIGGLPVLRGHGGGLPPATTKTV
jgi:WD40 repeat protein